MDRLHLTMLRSWTFMLTYRIVLAVLLWLQVKFLRSIPLSRVTNLLVSWMAVRAGCLSGLRSTVCMLVLFTLSMSIPLTVAQRTGSAPLTSEASCMGRGELIPVTQSMCLRLRMLSR